MLTRDDRVTLVTPQMRINESLACLLVTFKVRQCGDNVYNMTVRDQSDSVIWSDTPGKLIHLNITLNYTFIKNEILLVPIYIAISRNHPLSHLIF